MFDLENHLLQYRNTDPPDPQPALVHCDICGEPLYSGDSYYNVDDTIYCTDCMDDRRHKVDY